MKKSKKQGQRLIPEYLLDYAERLEVAHPDPTQEWGGSSSYNAGYGIEIVNDEISVDTNEIATVDALQGFTQTFGAEITAIYNGTSTVGKARQDGLGRTFDEYYASKSELFSGDYNDLTNKPTIPTKTSDLTNDSGFITNSALNGYATEQWVTNQGYSTFSGNYNDLTNKPTIPTKTSELTNDSNFIVAAALNDYVTLYYLRNDYDSSIKSWVEGQGYKKSITSSDVTSALGYTPGTSNFSGSYNDLTNKPTIPDAVSGTNDGTNWTTITIGNDTYSIPSGSTPSNMVTTNTNQTITGVKTFEGSKLINFKLGATETNPAGFTCYDSSGVERTNLQFGTRRVAGNTDYYLTLGNYSTDTTKSKVGFRLQPNNSTLSYNFIMPSGTNTEFTSAGYTTTNNNYIPCSFTNGTTVVNANSNGVVDINSLLKSETWTFTLSDNTTVTKNIVIK